MTRLSFRGVRFEWHERGIEHDKRFAEHDMPQKRGRWHEDMAPGAATYTVSGFLIAASQPLVWAKLRALEKACRNQRAGTLVHPIFGSINCVNTAFKAKESYDALNRIDLDLAFEEDNAATEPLATRWIGAALADAVVAAEQAIADGIDQVWSLVALPGYALAAATDGLAEISGALSGSTALLTSDVRSAIALPIALMTGAFIATGLSQPLSAAFRAYTTDSYGNPLRLTQDQANATYRALLPLATFTMAEEPTNTASRAVVAMALAGLSVTMRRLALLQLANLTRQMVFVSSNDAIATRDALYAAMDVEIVAAADDASINSNPVSATASQALALARAEMVADLTAVAATVVPVASVTLTRTMPALAVAYALYGDGDGSAGARSNTLVLLDDFVARNGLQDPGHAPGGVPLEYLAEGSFSGGATVGVRT